MKATKFGRPFSFSAKPVKLEGWYKYQAGENSPTRICKNLTAMTTEPFMLYSMRTSMKRKCRIALRR